MLQKFVYVFAVMLIGAPRAVAQETQAPAGSELAEPYNPFDDSSGTQTPPATDEPDLFEVPRPLDQTVEEPPQPGPTMLEPEAGVQPLDIPESPAVTPVAPDLEIDLNLLRGSPVDIPTREQVVPTPEATREQVPGVTN